MRYIRTFKESAEYFNLHGDDEYEITQLVRDDNHDYQYCDGILYELSHEGNDIVVGIDEVQNTDENMFYDDQIERYIEYFSEGGGTQTFPVSASPYKECYNLEDMLYYLDEPDNFDDAYEIFQPYSGIKHDKLYGFLTNKPISFTDFIIDQETYGFQADDVLNKISSVKDLDKYYFEDNDEDRAREMDEIYSDAYVPFDKDIYNGLVAVLKYWEDNKDYTLIDFNHRYMALKEMGKKYIMVDPS